MNRLLILSRDAKIYKEIIEKEKLTDLSIEATENPQEAINLYSQSNILFGEPHLISQVIEYLSNVGWVQSTWAGVDPLLPVNLRHDYVLTNARNVYGPIMAEYVFGYLLFIERRILSRWNSQKSRKWDTSPHGTLRGKTIGLLGVGTIGAHLAKTAKQFEMCIYGYTRQSEDCPEVDRFFHGKEIQAFAKGLDYLVCSLPNTPATTNIVNEDFLNTLPRTAWLINVGRGSTVDENALVNALQQKRLAGAVLDVFRDEPLPENHPLWETPNTFITAHTAAQNYPPDIASVFIENYKLYINGKPLHYQVDFEQHY